VERIRGQVARANGLAPGDAALAADRAREALEQERAGAWEAATGVPQPPGSAPGTARTFDFWGNSAEAIEEEAAKLDAAAAAEGELPASSPDPAAARGGGFAMPSMPTLPSLPKLAFGWGRGGEAPAQEAPAPAQEAQAQEAPAGGQTAAPASPGLLSFWGMPELPDDDSPAASGQTAAAAAGAGGDVTVAAAAAAQVAAEEAADADTDGLTADPDSDDSADGDAAPLVSAVEAVRAEVQEMRARVLAGGAADDSDTLGSPTPLAEAAAPEEGETPVPEGVGEEGAAPEAAAPEEPEEDGAAPEAAAPEEPEEDGAAPEAAAPEEPEEEGAADSEETDAVATGVVAPAGDGGKAEGEGPVAEEREPRGAIDVDEWGRPAHGGGPEATPGPSAGVAAEAMTEAASDVAGTAAGGASDATEAVAEAAAPAPVAVREQPSAQLATSAKDANVLSVLYIMLSSAPTEGPH